MMTVVMGIFGVLAWSLTEYLLHRFAFHNPAVTGGLAVEHRKHHRIEGYFTPAREKLGAVVPVVGALGGAAWLFGPPAFAFGGSFLCAYLGYELLHRALHVTPPRNRAGRWLRRHHLHHHFRNPASNHGVTSPLWDFVFRTYEPSRRVAIPRPRAPGWLLDAQGRPDPRFVNDYSLIGRLE